MKGYISRCKRKFRDENELKILYKGGLTDLFDNEIKLVYRITDDEYDYLSEKLSDDEMHYFVSESLTFNEKKKLLKILENILKNTLIIWFNKNLFIYLQHES